MLIHSLCRRFPAFALGLVLLIGSGWASADPPSRVARLGFTSGPVSFSPAGEDDWVRARINRPLTNGDRLWTDEDARAEIQVGGAAIRMSANTGVSVLNVDDRITQLQMTQGIVILRVRRLARDQVFEVATPNLAVTLRQNGEYRIEVDADDNSTDVIVRSGRAEVFGDGAAYAIEAGMPYRFYGSGLRDYQVVDQPALDRFDRWARNRDRSHDNSTSARYVSPDVVGYQDLDAHGTWRQDRTHGNVWFPNRVDADWTPYRDGHWSWIDPWGWTWVDDAPWGYAVSHYGRWANLGGTWGWVPGPVSTRAWYAPALVVFVGGSNLRVAHSGRDVGGVAWFPLAPREVYQPSYRVSPGYVENLNRSNTVINNTVVRNTVVNNTVVNNTVVNNVYTTNVTNVVYANRQVAGAVIAVPTATFAQSQPVAKTAVRVTPQMAVASTVAVVAAVAPTATSVRGAAETGAPPPQRVFTRPVVARTAPPAVHAGFAAQQQQLAANPGKPLEDEARKALKPASVVPAQVVKVVAPVQTSQAAQSAQASALPAPAASIARPGRAQARAEGRTVAAAPASAAVASVSPVSPASPSSPVMPSSPASAPSTSARANTEPATTGAVAVPRPPASAAPAARRAASATQPLPSQAAASASTTPARLPTSEPLPEATQPRAAASRPGRARAEGARSPDGPASAAGPDSANRPVRPDVGQSNDGLRAPPGALQRPPRAELRGAQPPRPAASAPLGPRNLTDEQRRLEEIRRQKG